MPDTTAVSFFHGSTNSRPVKAMALNAVLADIQTGIYRDAILKVRHVRTTEGKGAYATAKRDLDAFTPCATFAPTRGKANLQHTSGICHGDIDHLSQEELRAACQAIYRDPYTRYCFVSPSQEGLKVGVKIPLVTDDTEYKRYWQAVADYYATQYGVTWDESGKDVSRLCYVSYDPDLYEVVASFTNWPNGL